MASISVGGGPGGKKSVDSEIPLVPFIDLLLCCVMFLLVTAVWNQLASVEGALDTPGSPDSEMTQVEDRIPLIVRLTEAGVTLSSEAGDRIDVPLTADGELDGEALHEQLSARHRLEPNEDTAIVTADDGVRYARMIAAMDVVSASGYPRVTVSGTP
ncbi:MAG: ExbD/TolR family protein [Sandaracinaceae bacterium]